uniref:Btz domain-containing protein n=1 Tax=Colobus angolensis palliatus TaxID=336983 RepID=A0A2K5HAK4_COLAP
MVCSNSRSHSSRSESGSQSRSHSKKKSRSRTYSRSRSRDHMYSRDYRRGIGYYQGGGGRYHRGGYRPVWNRRHSRKSQEKQTKKAEGEPQEESPLKSKSQEEPKDTFEHDPPEFIDEFNKSSVTSDDIWPGLSAYDNSPRSPHSPSPIATPPSQSSSCSDPPMLSTVHSAKNIPSQHSHSIQHSPERSGSGSVGNGYSRYSPSQNSPIYHIPSRRSPAKIIAPQNVPRDESGAIPHFILMVEIRKLKDWEVLKKTPLHKNLDSAFREENPLRIKMIASACHHPEFRLKMACVPLDDSNRPASLTKDRLLASTLVHSLPQASNSTSESFIQHIVSLVHHVEEQYFKIAAMTLNERFTSHQNTRQKSPEIHRRIDISPSTLKKHTHLAGEERVFKEKNQKGDKKLRCDSVDFWHDIDHHRKERSKEQGDSKGSRESSGSRKQEKTPKDYKEYKSYKDESKHKSREQDHSRSSSSSASPSSPSSREEKESKKEGEEKCKTHHEMEEFSGFGGISRGRARGVFAGTNTGPNNSNTTIQKRLKEEEWDPEYTPKSKKYFLHDDRDDGVDYWAKRRKGRGTFQCGRGRFNFKKSGSRPKWTHDRYQRDGIVGDKEETVENNEEKKDRCKEEKE